ncbi:bestrophin homolog [Trichonephila clavipes]|nr:bestrophin homolog [Trichonephila clavipes]
MILKPKVVYTLLNETLRRSLEASPFENTRGAPRKTIGTFRRQRRGLFVLCYFAVALPNLNLDPERDASAGQGQLTLSLLSPLSSFPPSVCREEKGKQKFLEIQLQAEDQLRRTTEPSKIEPPPQSAGGSTDDPEVESSSDEMTVSYQYDVASSASGGFIRLLFRWRGSVWKVVYREMLLFTVCYIVLSLLYNFALTEGQQRSTVPISVYLTLDPEVHEQMFRSGGQPDVKPPVLSSQASLVLIYRPTEGMKS